MEYKKYKWIFYIFTFLLITIVATVLSAMKPGDKVPDVSNAILLVGAVYLGLYLLFKLTTKLLATRGGKFDEGSRKERSFPKPKMIHLVIAGLVILLLGGFYWFELRPAKIRQECSWIKHTNEAVPAKPAMSEEELKAEGLIKNCTEEETKGYKSIFENPYLSLYKNECPRKNKQIIEEYKTARTAIPAKDWYSKASEKQYDFCIRENGLVR